jgi:hypothetical protein
MIVRTDKRSKAMQDRVFCPSVTIVTWENDRILLMSGTTSIKDWGGRSKILKNWEERTPMPKGCFLCGDRAHAEHL